MEELSVAVSHLQDQSVISRVRVVDAATFLTVRPDGYDTKPFAPEA